MSEVESAESSILGERGMNVPHCKLRRIEQTTPTVAPAPATRCSAQAISVRVRGEFGKESQPALFKSWDVIQDVLVLFLV